MLFTIEWRTSNRIMDTTGTPACAEQKQLIKWLLALLPHIDHKLSHNNRI